MLLASRILCHAAMRLGVPVVSGEIRNMSQRGGAVHATVALGGARSTLIPKGRADTVLAFEPMEAVRAVAYMGPQTTAIVNERPVVPFTLSVRGLPYPPLESLLSRVRERCGTLTTLDASRVALDVGDLRALNMVMLGALSACDGFPLEGATIEQVIADGSREPFAPTNVDAYRAGVSGPAGAAAGRDGKPNRREA